MSGGAAATAAADAAARGAGGSSHVHFNPDQVSHHDLEIIVEPAGPGSVDVHLGFLQVNHVYEVDVPIVHRLGDSVRVCDGEGDGDASLGNLFVRLKSHQRSSEAGADIFRFELFAHKERLMRETLVLCSDGEGSSDPASRLTVQFHARVLGKLKGTPALKNGIKCVGMRSEDEGDCSDWQGFD